MCEQCDRDPQVRLEQALEATLHELNALRRGTPMWHEVRKRMEDLVGKQVQMHQALDVVEQVARTLYETGMPCAPYDQTRPS